jgi:hypothetical protein
MPARQKVTRYVGDLLVCQERLQEVFGGVVCACNNLAWYFTQRAFADTGMTGLSLKTQSYGKPANSSKLNDYFTN